MNVYEHPNIPAVGHCRLREGSRVQFYSFFKGKQLCYLIGDVAAYVPGLMGMFQTTALSAGQRVQMCIFLRIFPGRIFDQNRTLWERIEYTIFLQYGHYWTTKIKQMQDNTYISSNEYQYNQITQKRIRIIVSKMSHKATIHKNDT